MTYTYAASTTAGAASGNALSVNKPASTVDGDLLIAQFYWEGASQSITPPTGWTAFITPNPERNTGVTPNFLLWAFWKFASSEPASWSWTPSVNANFRIGGVARYTPPGTGTSNPTDAIAGGAGVANSSPWPGAPSVTTTAASETVLGMVDNFAGDATTYSSGVPSNQRFSLDGLQLYDGVKTTAGATGAFAVTFGTETYCGLQIALLDNSSNTTPSSSDSATLTDVVSNIGLNGPADTASATETSKIGLGSSDSATLAEQTAIALLNTDSAAFSEQVAIAAATTSQDTATLAEQVKLALGATDSAHLGEAMALALAHQDTATLQELVSVAIAIADAATLTEGASVTQNGGNTPTSSDAATLTESASSTAAVSTSDIGALAEQAAVKLGASDVAAMTEQIGLALVAADNAALVEQLHLAVANAASDAAALGELQNVVAAVLAAAETASLSDAARVTQNGVSSSSLKTFTLQPRSLSFTVGARSVTFTLAKP